MNDPINEGDTAFWTLKLFDSGGGPGAPQQAFLSVDCRTNHVETLAEIAIATTSTQTVTIPGSATQIINPANAFEIRRAKVRCVYGVGDDFTTLQDFAVRNLAL